MNHSSRYDNVKILWNEWMVKTWEGWWFMAWNFFLEVTFARSIKQIWIYWGIIVLKQTDIKWCSTVRYYYSLVSLIDELSGLINWRYMLKICYLFTCLFIFDYKEKFKFSCFAWFDNLLIFWLKQILKTTHHQTFQSMIWCGQRFDFATRFMC